MPSLSMMLLRIGTTAAADIWEVQAQSWTFVIANQAARLNTTEPHRGSNPGPVIPKQCVSLNDLRLLTASMHAKIQRILLSVAISLKLRDTHSALPRWPDLLPMAGERRSCSLSLHGE